MHQSVLRFICFTALGITTDVNKYKIRCFLLLTNTTSRYPVQCTMSEHIRWNYEHKSIIFCNNEEVTLTMTNCRTRWHT